MQNRYRRTNRRKDNPKGEGGSSHPSRKVGFRRQSDLMKKIMQMRYPYHPVFLEDLKEKS